ncbi:MAG: hypothetical protein M0Q01_00940 [Syntrophales bacterium]|jgi:hypothetical protein|nr:hypothetical protein [Syntrophales bacterium]
MESTDQEIRREKVFIPQGMSVNEITEKYGISRSSARTSFKRGWFIKNYARNQIIIDREHFNPALCYSIAKQVYWKRFRKNPVAESIKDDLIQEAVSLMFMQSGKVKAGANEKYNERYGFWWTAFNGMLAYLDKWVRQTQWDVELSDEIHPMMMNGNRRWSPEYGWGYC